VSDRTRDLKVFLAVMAAIGILLALFLAWAATWPWA
jgi:hypothetical protein